MLHEESIESETLELLKMLQAMHEIEDFRLVGGTALALQFGHRISIDLDFFGQIDFSTINFNVLLSRFTDVRIINNSPHIKQYFVNNIKVDFVQLPYQWIDEPFVDQEVIMATPKEIGAMKLAAITNRGSKKDFVDIFFLLQHFKLKQLLEFYKKKYPDGSEFLVLKSLTYFDDADDEEMPEMLMPIAWEEIKGKIIEEHLTHIASN